MRKVLCWIGVIAIAILLLSASRYDVPVTGGHWEYVERYEGRQGGEVWVEEKDYSNVPLWVKVGSECGMIPVVFGLVLLYGALKK